MSELAQRSLFSMAWLDSVNREREQRGASRLDRCLVSANGDVFKVPWEDLVYPQFVSRPRTVLKEDKQSNIKDADMFIPTSHQSSRETEQDVKLHPSSTKTDQSAASSETEDSEGEYVELTELPLPRFSPQQGSLTQSISLQHRTRSSSHISTNAPQNKHTPAANTHTHKPPTHTSANTQTPEHCHTHTSSTTHSTWPCVQGSFSLIDEDLKQDTCGHVSLTPISSSSSLREGVGTSRSQSGHRPSHEQIGGTGSAGSPNPYTEPEDCTAQREDEERGKEVVTGEEREEKEPMEMQEGKNDILVSVDDNIEKEEEQVQEEILEHLEITVCKREEILLTEMQTAEEVRELEEYDDESEETEEEGDEEGELEEEEAVVVDEMVQVMVVQLSQASREDVEQQIIHGGDKGMRGGGGEDKEEEDRGGGPTLTFNEPHSQIKTNAEDSYSESTTDHKHPEISYSESDMFQTHTEESNSRNNTHIQSEDSSSGRTGNSYSDNNTLSTHLEESNASLGVSTVMMDPGPRWEEHQDSGHGQKEEEEEECSCEEVGGGRTAELHTEGTETSFSSFFHIVVFTRVAKFWEFPKLESYHGN